MSRAESIAQRAKEVPRLKLETDESAPNDLDTFLRGNVGTLAASVNMAVSARGLDPLMRFIAALGV